MRHFELPNREHIRRVMEAGGGDGSMFAPVRVEHQLAMLAPRSSTRLVAPTGATGTATHGLRALFQRRTPPRPDDEILVQDHGDRVCYEHAGQPLLAHEGGAALDGPCEALVQFLRYRWG